MLLLLGWSLLALKDLLVHAKRVGTALEQADLPEAKRQVSRLVSRDTERMNLHACGRAAVESVSENLNDGVIAPLFLVCSRRNSGHGSLQGSKYAGFDGGLPQ